MKRYKTVDEFVAGQTQWQAEVVRLREILLATPLTEEVKWGAPCYTHNGKNLIGIGAFKSYFGLWFFQGALLSDPSGVLANAQEGRTKAMRQWRFESMQAIKPRIIKAYAKEAIAICEQGREIKPARGTGFDMPIELQQALAQDAKLRKNFEAFTPGRQREFAEYIASAKRAGTKAKRLEKIKPMITAGTGLNDKYRKC